MRAAGSAMDADQRCALRPEMADAIHAPPDAPTRRIGIAGPIRTGRGDAGSQHAHVPPLWSLAAVLAAKCAANMAVSVLGQTADRLRCRDTAYRLGILVRRASEIGGFLSRIQKLPRSRAGHQRICGQARNGNQLGNRWYLICRSRLRQQHKQAV